MKVVYSIICNNMSCHYTFMYTNTCLDIIFHTCKDQQLPQVIRRIFKFPKVNKTTITKLAGHTFNCRLDEIESEETGTCAIKIEKKNKINSWKPL